jgi:hypothetical protein
MPDRIEFRYSPQGQLGLLVVGCVLTGISSFVALTNEDVVYRTVGWLGAAVMALCAFIAAGRLLAGGVPFAFDLGGISFPGGSFGLLPWTEVKSYAVVTVRGHYFLALTFHDPARVLSRVPAMKRRWAMANQRLGWGHWALSFSGLSPGMDEAITFIREHSLIPASTTASA